MKIKENLEKPGVMMSLVYILGTVSGANIPPETIPVLSDLILSWF